MSLSLKKYIDYFETSSDWFRVIITRAHLPEYGEEDTAKDTVKLNENMNKIIPLIKENKYITTDEISKKIKINDRNTKKNISKLKELGLLKRIGPDKGGHWEILE